MKKNELTSKKSKGAELPSLLPVVPLRDTVIFPNTMFPILVGRPATIAAINQAVQGDKYIFLCAQKDPDEEHPKTKGLHKKGILAQVIQVLHLPNDLLKVLISGIQAADVNEFKEKETYLTAKITPENPDNIKMTSRLKALVRKTKEGFEKLVYLNQDLPEEILLGFEQNYNPVNLLYFMASYMDLDIHEKQKILEEHRLEEKYKTILTHLASELELLAVSQEINEKVQDEIQETQRKFYIQEQIKVLQDELDEDGFSDPELARLKEKLDALELPETAHMKATEELERLKKTPAMSPEYSVSRNYLDWILAMPWNTLSEDNLDISTVKNALEKDHFGLEKPKERILEYIAVLNLVKKIRGQILCFVGAPGTGKTSLAKSIAEAMNRKMVRISLGGVSDEAEIRGHRKTYIGSMPGRIIQAIKKAGTMNPVIILDEIDKLGHDFRGDPSSAVLEVLDPEQNDTFNDHYMDLDFDLSQVMFITTANVASNIQPALLDRMEIIPLHGYLEHEKMEIAKKHLIPKLLASHGLASEKIRFKDEALLLVIRKYTAEAGVRVLEQKMAALCRKIARKMVDQKKEGKRFSQITINEKRIREFLGVETFKERSIDKTDRPGSVVGLAWTSTGGSTLQLDVARMYGKNKLMLTGKLGDVMKESAQAALTYIRSNSSLFGLEDDVFEKTELHVHIPEGAIPKDGPSAGMGIALAMISLLTNTPARHDVAVTGEITLQGNIFAIGGLNEKLLAAKRKGITKVLIPKENTPDLEEIPDKVKKGLEIVGVDHISECFQHIFRKPGFLKNHR
ncbi:endopeptidase La [Balneolaceae bacterium ANBcel3]|nr:endopeptidase La [Balneolaceae bacterium ANBcel3]